MATSSSSFRSSVDLRGNRFYPDCDPPPQCDTTPLCLACGGLECLCRPHFFAGQLLTEEDLNRLDHYITAKHRLHNRYLVGSGVACGLEVICALCGAGDSKVTVRPGYAVSPCGNDIVVCKNTTVDIGDLIARCRPQTDDDCVSLFHSKEGGFAHAGHDASPECDGGTQVWVLAVCYTEKPSRDVGAVRTSSKGPGDCSCGCGGGSDCSCGGAPANRSGSASASGCGCAAQTAAPAKKAPLSCEPTLTCEGYGFKVYKAPNEKLKARYGEAARRYMCCILPLIENIRGSMTDKTFDHGQTYDYLIGLRNALAEFIRTQGFYDCELASRLAAVAVTAPDSGHFDLGKKTGKRLLMQSYATSLHGFSAVGEEVLKKCLCAALLPPCSPTHMADCVPLATVTVTAGECKVLKVCNIGVREFLPTWPNIQYWMSFLDNKGNILARLRRILERMCCTPHKGATIGIKDRVRDYVMQVQSDSVASPGKGKEHMSKKSKTQASESASPMNFADFLASALARPERKVDAQSFFLGSLGMNDSDGTPLLSEAEQARPTDFLLAHQVVAPLLKELLPASMLAMLAQPHGASSPFTANVDALARQVQAMKQQMAAQQKAIEVLSKHHKP